MEKVLKKLFNFVDQKFNVGLLMLLAGLIFLGLKFEDSNITLKSVIVSWQMLLILSGSIVMVLKFIREQKYIYEWDIITKTQNNGGEEKTYSDYFDIFVG